MALAVIGCKKEPPGPARIPSTAPPVLPVQGAPLGPSYGGPPPSHSEPALLPPPPAPRRERAGIELGPPAVREPEPPETLPEMRHEAPEILENEEVDVARAGLAFVFSWRMTIEAGDADGYATLLHQDFKGWATGGGDASTWDRARWLERVRSECARPPQLELGPPHITIVRGETTKVTVRFHERVDRGADGCRVGDRELTMLMPQRTGKRVLLASEGVRDAGPCPTITATEVAAAHMQLARRFGGGEPEEEPWQPPPVRVLDHGLVRGTLGPDELLNGRGRWLTERLVAAEADQDNTKVCGRVGMVRDAFGNDFVYEKTAEGWQLTSLSRGF